VGTEPTVVRVVFDTNTVVSALLFRGALSGLVEHWRSGASVPLVSRATANELLRVLPQIEAFAALYLPFAERVEVDEPTLSFSQCRDPSDRMFLALG
jgi:putative PIN family toxin of toxin-antitoxin system